MALVTNLVSYWKFDEASGNAADIVASNTLTNNGTATFSAGKINNGTSLNGTSQYFSIADASQTGLDFSGDMSVQVWFKPSANVTSEQELVTKFINAGQKAYRFYADNGTLHYGNSTDGTTATDASLSLTMTSGNWYHLIASLSSGTVTLYANGSSLGTGSVSATIFNGTDAFRVGTRVASGDFAAGLIDEVGVWSRALSGAEITQLYNAGAGLAYPLTAQLSVSASDSTAITDTATITRKYLVSLSDSTAVTDTAKVEFLSIFSVSDIFAVSDTVSLKYEWLTQRKDSSAWTGGTEHSSLWTDFPIDSSTFATQQKS